MVEKKKAPNNKNTTAPKHKKESEEKNMFTIYKQAKKATYKGYFEDSLCGYTFCHLLFETAGGSFINEQYGPRDDQQQARDYAATLNKGDRVDCYTYGRGKYAGYTINPARVEEWQARNK